MSGGKVRRCRRCGRELIEALYGAGNTGRGAGAPRRRRKTWIHRETSRHACRPEDLDRPPGPP